MNYKFSLDTSFLMIFHCGIYCLKLIAFLRFGSGSASPAKTLQIIFSCLLWSSRGLQSQKRVGGLAARGRQQSNFPERTWRWQRVGECSMFRWNFRVFIFLLFCWIVVYFISFSRQVA